MRRHLKALCTLAAMIGGVVATGAAMAALAMIVAYWHPWFWLTLTLAAAGTLAYRRLLKFVDEWWS